MADPTTIAQLRQSEYRVLPVKEEMRKNLVRKIKTSEELFPGIIGYEGSVIPQVENAILSGQDIVFLGERGQAKTRMARLLTELLDADTRAILFLCCSEHVVGCQRCQNSYRLRWLPRTDLGLYACPLCGNDLTAAVLAHTETCWYWATRRATRKPPARIERQYPLADAAS